MFANHRPLLAYLKALGGKRLPWDANSEPCFEEALLSLSLIIIIELYLSKSTIERDILSKYLVSSPTLKLRNMSVGSILNLTCKILLLESSINEDR